MCVSMTVAVCTDLDHSLDSGSRVLLDTPILAGIAAVQDGGVKQDTTPGETKKCTQSSVYNYELPENRMMVHVAN